MIEEPPSDPVVEFFLLNPPNTFALSEDAGLGVNSMAHFEILIEKSIEEFISRKDVANFPLLSLFRFFFPTDGDTCNFNTLHNY